MKKKHPRWTLVDGFDNMRRMEFYMAIGPYDIWVGKPTEDPAEVDPVVVVWGSAYATWSPLRRDRYTDDSVAASYWKNGWHSDFLKNGPSSHREEVRQVAEAYAKLLS